MFLDVSRTCWHRFFFRKITLESPYHHLLVISPYCHIGQILRCSFVPWSRPSFDPGCGRALRSSCCLCDVWCVMIGVTVTDLWWTANTCCCLLACFFCKFVLWLCSVCFPFLSMCIFLYPFLMFPFGFVSYHKYIYIHVHSLWFFPVFLPPCLHVSCRWAFLLVNALKLRFQHPSVSGRNSWDERCALGWARMLCQGWNATHITYVWDEGYPGIAFKHHQASFFLWDGTHSCTVWTNWG